jgi:hypothetical protein
VIASGMLIEMAQRELGCGPPGATTINLTTTQQRRCMEAVQRFWSAAMPAPPSPATPDEPAKVEST